VSDTVAPTKQQTNERTPSKRANEQTLFRNIEKLPSSKKENKVTVSKIDNWPPPVPPLPRRSQAQEIKKSRNRRKIIDEK